MNKKQKFTILIVFTTLLVSNSLGAIEYPNGIEVNDSYIEVGETITYSAEIDSNEKIVSASGRATNWMQYDSSSDCFNTYNGCEASFTYTPNSGGEKNLSIRATSESMNDYKYINRFITVYTEPRDTSVEFTTIPSSFTEGNSYDITASAHDSAGQLYSQQFVMEERKDTQDGWTDWEQIGSKRCWSSQEDCSLTGTFNPTSSGDYEIRASITTEDGVEISNTETVNVQSDQSVSVDISNIRSTNTDIREGENTRFKADITPNQDLDYLEITFSSGGHEFDTVQQYSNLDADSTITITSDQISYSDLSSQLSTGQDHDLDVQLHNDRFDGSSSATDAFYLAEAEEELSVDISNIRSTDTDIEEGESTEFKVDITPNQDLDYLEITFSSGSTEFDTVQQYSNLEAGSTLTITTDSITWDQLAANLNTDQDHDLTVQLHNDRYDDSSTANNAFYLNSAQEPEPLSIDISNIRSTDTNIEEGEDTRFKVDLNPNRDVDYLEITFSSGGNDLRLEQESNLDSGSTTTVTSESISWSELKDYLATGQEHDLTVQVSNYNFDETSTSNNAFTLAEAPEEPAAVELNSVSASRYTLSEGQNTQLRAQVESNQPAYTLAYVTMKWKADGDIIARRNQFISGGTTETVSKTVTYQDLRDEGLETGTDYNLQGTMEFDLENIQQTRSAPNDLRLNPESAQDFSISSYGPSGDITNPVNLYVELGSNPGTGWCKWQEGSSVSRSGSTRMSKPDASEPRWEYSTDFSAGSHTVSFQCFNHDRSITGERTTTFNVQSGTGTRVDIERVWSTNEDISRGESTNLKTRLNFNQDVSYLEVQFYVNGKELAVNQLYNVESGDERTVSSSKTWQQLSSELETGRSHDLRVRIKNDQIDKSRTSRDAFYLREHITSVKPTPRFSWTPAQPQPNQQVTFDASASTDPQNDIESYVWYFGDGSSRATGRTVTHTYSDTGDYDVQLVVEDEEGNSESRTRTVPIRWSPEACSVQVSSLRLGRPYIVKGETTSATISVSNLGERQEFNVKFLRSGNIIQERDVVIESNSQRTFTKAISPSQDSFIEARITTENPPCNYKQWTRTEELIVIPGGGTQESTLQVNVQNSQGRRLSGARVSVERPTGDNLVRYTSSSGSANFGLSSGSFDVSVSKTGYDSEFRTVDLQSGQHRTITVTLDRREGDLGSLIALVEDSEGNRLQNAQVTVTDVGRTRTTDSNGRATINLEEGTYTVRAEKEGYGQRIKTVDIQENQDTVEVFHLSDTEGLQITDIQYPSNVCRGSTMRATVTIENTGGLHQFVSLTGSGLGSINAVNSFSLDSGSSVTKTIYFTNVQGSGSEEFTVTVSNSGSDQMTRTVQVDSCPVPATQKPTDISLSVSYPKKPQMAVEGDIIKLDGFVDGVNGRSTVDILIDDEVKATVNTNPGGYYQTWITAQDVGPHTITAKAGEATATKPLRIIPTSQVTGIEAPVSVFESQDYQVCAQVSSQITPEVVLVRDGQVVTSKQEKGRVCFNRSARQPGMHKYEIAALTSGPGNTASTNVEVLEMDVEASSFPNQIASVESGSGIVKVELYNNNDDQKEYNLDLAGLPSTWIAQSEKTVILEKGERRTVYFYLTPQEEGSYRPTITVTSEGSQVYEEELDVITGGTTESNPGKSGGFFNSIIEGLSSLFSF